MKRLLSEMKEKDGPRSKSKQVHGACENKEADLVVNCNMNSQPTVLL